MGLDVLPVPSCMTLIGSDDDLHSAGGGCVVARLPLWAQGMDGHGGGRHARHRRADGPGACLDLGLNAPGADAEPPAATVNPCDSWRAPDPGYPSIPIDDRGPGTQAASDGIAPEFFGSTGVE